MSASVLLIYFLSTRPPVQKNVLNRILVLVAIAIIIGCTRCFAISTAACFWQEQLKVIMEENPTLISVLSYRYFVIFGASLLCAMSAGRLLLMTNPVVFHGINPTTGAVVLCFVTVLICVLDFTYGWILCFGSSSTKILITNFEKEIGIWKEDVQNQTTLAEYWTQNDYCIQLPTLIIILLLTLVLEFFKFVFVFLKEIRKLKKTKTDTVWSKVDQPIHQSVTVSQKDEVTGRQNSSKCLKSLTVDCSSNLKSESRKLSILSIEVIGLETAAPTLKTEELYSADSCSSLTLDYRKQSLPMMEVIDLKTTAPTLNLKLYPRKQYLPPYEVIDLETNAPTPNVDILKAGESHPSDNQLNQKSDSKKQSKHSIEVIDIEKAEISKAGELHSSDACSNIKLDSRKHSLPGMEFIDLNTTSPTPNLKLDHRKQYLSTIEIIDLETNALSPNEEAGESLPSVTWSNLKSNSRKKFLPALEVIDLENDAPSSNLELDSRKQSPLTIKVIDLESNATTPNVEILRAEESLPSDTHLNLKSDSRKQFLPALEVIDLETNAPSSNLELDKKQSLLTNEVIDVETIAPTLNEEIPKNREALCYTIEMGKISDLGKDIWKKFGLRSSSFVTVFLFIGFFIVIFSRDSYSSFRNTSQIVLLRFTAFVLMVFLVSVDKDIGIFLIEILQRN